MGGHVLTGIPATSRHPPGRRHLFQLRIISDAQNFVGRQTNQKIISSGTASHTLTNNRVETFSSQPCDYNFNNYIATTDHRLSLDEDVHYSLLSCYVYNVLHACQLSCLYGAYLLSMWKSEHHISYPSMLR